MGIDLLWVALFVFSLAVIVFSLGGIIANKPYWRFGVGFGVGVVFMLLWLAFIGPLLASWPLPLLLFVGIPIVIAVMLVLFCLATALGILLYGERRWNNDRQL